MQDGYKKLYKSDTNKILTGVIGGIGEYFDIDPTILRLGFIILILITAVFPGLIAYIIAYFLVPKKPANSHQTVDNTQQKNTNIQPVPTIPPTKTPAPQTKTYPTINIQSELTIMDINTEDTERYKPDERPTPEVVSQLAIPPETDQSLKKPNWTEVSQQIIDISRQTENSETPTLDSLMEDRGVNLDDLLSE